MGRGGVGCERCGANTLDIVLASHPAAPPALAAVRRCWSTTLTLSSPLLSLLRFSLLPAARTVPRLHRSSSSSSEPQKERAAICRVSERVSCVRPSGLGLGSARVPIVNRSLGVFGSYYSLLIRRVEPKQLRV